MELQFGEWLRDALLSGVVEPEPAENPDLAVLITMVRQTGRALIGPAATDLLDAVPRADLVRAMLDGVPSLMSDLDRRHPQRAAHARADLDDGRDRGDPLQGRGRRLGPVTAARGRSTNAGSRP